MTILKIVFLMFAFLTKGGEFLNFIFILMSQCKTICESIMTKSEIAVSGIIITLFLEELMEKHYNAKTIFYIYCGIWRNVSRVTSFYIIIIAAVKLSYKKH